AVWSGVSGSAGMPSFARSFSACRYASIIGDPPGGMGDLAYAGPSMETNRVYKPAYYTQLA
ncbi:MAG TPA: hypothetical protein VI078_08815, partial [bacterium]